MLKPQYSTVPGVQIAGGDLETLISGGQIKRGMGKFGNLYLKMRYNFALFMPTLILILLIFFENIPLAHRESLKDLESIVNI